MHGSRTPDQVIEAMAFYVASKHVGAFVLADEEIRRLVDAWREMRARDFQKSDEN